MERFFDRDISWLAFNARALQEAADPEEPRFARVRFKAFRINNLDHRVEVRVPALDPAVRADLLLDTETPWHDPVKARVIDEHLSSAYVFPGRDPGADGHTRRYRHFQNLVMPGA